MSENTHLYLYSGGSDNIINKFELSSILEENNSKEFLSLNKYQTSVDLEDLVHSICIVSKHSTLLIGLYCKIIEIDFNLNKHNNEYTNLSDAVTSIIDLNNNLFLINCDEIQIIDFYCKKLIYRTNLYGVANIILPDFINLFNYDKETLCLFANTTSEIVKLNINNTKVVDLTYYKSEILINKEQLNKSIRAFDIAFLPNSSYNIDILNCKNTDIVENSYIIFYGGDDMTVNTFIQNNTKITAVILESFVLSILISNNPNNCEDSLFVYAGLFDGKIVKLLFENKKKLLTILLKVQEFSFGVNQILNLNFKSNQYLIARSYSNTIKIITSENLNETINLNRHYNKVNCVCFLNN
jgi:hypothetical protein